jgi:hypothetical protein
MKNLLSILALGFAFSACAPLAFAQTGATPPPTKQCDEAKAELYKKLNCDFCHGRPEEQKASCEAGKEFLRVCSAAQDEETRQTLKYVRNWIEKYDAAVREFELRQAAARLRGTLGANAADALKGLLTKTR